MKKTLFIAMIILIILGIFMLLNIKLKSKNDSTKIKVITTLFPLYDFAKIIGQDNIDVVLLLPPGVEPHAFEPKPSDIIKINEFDLFVYTGDFMEPWAEDIVKGISSKKDIKIVNSSIGIELMHNKHSHKGEHNEHKHSSVDPHIWLNFDNSSIIVENITNALIEKDPENADFYTKNARDYKIKLTQLDNRYKTELAECKNKKIIYGGHHAFGYMEQKYDLVYESAYGISPDSEPSAKDLISLTEQILKDNIKYIFFEELLNPKVAETLALETGAGLLVLNPAHNLIKEDFEKNISFLSIMEGNLNNLKTGLQCN